MKMRKILSVLLAALMILSAVPMMFMTATAAEAAQAAASTEPATLPDTGFAYDTTHPLFNKDIPGGETGWKEYRPDGINDFIPNGVQGVIFDIDGTAMADGAVMGVTFNLNVELVKADGSKVGTYLSPTPYGAAIMGSTYTNVPLNGETSTWYISYDGLTWESFDIYRSLNEDGSTKTGGRYAEIAIGGKAATVYVPMSEFWTRDGVKYLETGEHPSGMEDTVDYETFMSYGQTWRLKTTSHQFAWGGTNSGAQLSNFRLVDTRVIDSASITLTDDLAYNVYANVPAGVTDDKVTFTMGEKTATVAGEKQPDGKVKYTFDGILPQEIGETINYTWSATVNGGEFSKSKSGSVLAYAQALLADDTKTDWHDLAKALLHYGAAAQAYKGVTEGFVNDGIDALTPVDRAALTVAYENGNKEVFKTAALRLDNAIALKIGVAAADGTDVTWEGGSAKVQNGYVYVSVNAYQMSDAITLTCGEDTLTISASWYLKNADTTDNAALEALIQAITDYAAAAEALA